ncbi:MAG: ABC transporter permease [Alloacidobacterium sp.]|jgi:macrolide transport system ATP-binding/permease protein
MKRRKRMLEELDQDIRDHLESETQDNLDRGMSPEEARHAALRKFGNVTRVKEETWEVWSVVWLEQLLQDTRFGLRTLWRSPGLTVAAVLAIALGIGVNVGVFSVLNGVALRLLPIPRAEQIVSVNQIFHGRFSRNTHGEGSMFSYAEYLDYRDHNHVFTGLVAYEPFVEATLAGGDVQQLLGTATSCNYFEVLSERPAHGRGFASSDCAAPGENAVVVVSDDLWRGRFAGDPSLVGKRIILNRTAYTVVGIARPGFTGTELIPSAFWAPITLQKALEPGIDRLADANMSWLALLGRTKDGITMQQVRADLDVIAGRIDRLHPGRTTSLAIHTATFFSSPEEREFLIPAASVVLAAFALVLLIACANVANLLLARASVRQREIALRLSIGASRWRLVRQLLTESLLLSLAGGVLGSVVAFWSFVKITQLVVSHLPHGLPAITLNVAPNLHVLAYALLLTVLTGITFGLIPALQSSRLDLNATMKGDGTVPGSGKRSRRLLLNTLVGSQVAVCMVLLLAAGLLLRGLYYAQTVNPGFEEKNIAQVFLNLGTQGYDENRATAFIARLRERIRGYPGVIDVAQAECAPLSHDFSADHFSIPGRPDKIPTEYNHVSPNYFSLVGIPIVRGRGFTSAETRDAQGIIVTESTARRLWPGEDPLAKTLREETGREYSVIGVAKDAQVSHLGELNTSYLYFPGPADSRTYVLIRYAPDFTEIANGIRDAAKSIDPDVSVDVTKLEDNLEVWRAPSRIVAGLAGTLGAVALLLASIGVYGMVSYSVSRSVREIGIRMALGANGADVMSHVLWQAMRPVLIGGLVGVALCAGVSGVLSGMMFGVSAHDPIAFISVPFFLMAVALLASFIPARRAMRVDPMVALRCE